MPSTPKDSTQRRTTSGVACYHLHWVAHTVRLRRAWHEITSLGQHTWSDDIGRGMPSSSLGSTNGRTTPTWHANITFGQHTRSNDVRCGMQASPLGSTHGQKTSSVAWHHLLWTAHTVEQRRARHAITAFGKHTRPIDVECGMQSSPLGSTNSRTGKQG